MNEEVKNEETAEQENPSIKYTNKDGNEIEIPMSDLNEAETNIANNIDTVTKSLQKIDDAHITNLTRQSLVLNHELLNDSLKRELLRFDDETPEIITETKEIRPENTYPAPKKGG
jgi:hypothetical protein|tara:strand:+ start:855 stop:1199 length:345 start_codon:yes stop_codon:yes gene_type:complete